MTRNQIISELYQSKEFNDCINKMEPEHLRADLRSEIILILLEKPAGVIEGLYQRGELKWYVVRIILNQVCSNNSPFIKRYRSATTDLIPEIPAKELNGRVHKEMLEEPVYSILKKLRPLAYEKIPNYKTELFPLINWYEQYMVSLYMKVGGFRAIEKETRIPWESAYTTVRKVITKIRKEVLNVTE